MSVMSEVGLTTDRDLAEHLCLRNTTSFMPPWHQKSHGTSHYTRHCYKKILENFLKKQSIHLQTTPERSYERSEST